MIVSCPACATRFSLDATLLGPNGRNVRCAKCGHRWRQEPPAAQAELPPVDLDQPAAVSPAAETAPPPGQMAPGLAALLGGAQVSQPEAPKPAAAVVVPPKLQPAKPARKVGLWPWVLAAGVICGLAAAAYLFQGPIMRTVPGAQDIYSLLGLGERDPAKELLIGNLKSEQRSGLVSIRGDVFNPTELPLKIPPLLLAGKDAEGRPIGDGLMFRTQESEIAPGETVTFRILYENAPQGMKKFAVTFGRLDAREP